MNYPIRVLYVVTIMDAGGIENMLMNLYRNIDRNKIQFDFIVHRDKKGLFDDEIISLGGKIYKFQPLAINKLFNYQKQLRDFFNRHKEYKIIHSHISVWSYIILNQAKKSNVPIRIAHSHESHNSIWEHKFLRIPLIWFLKKIINRPLTHRFACGIDAGKWLFGSNNDFSVINNSIDTELFIYNKEKSNSIKMGLSLKSSFIIGHVGNFSKPKNYPFILDVFKKIVEKVPDSKLILVGNNSNDTSIELTCADMNLNNNVLFTGVRTDVYDLYQIMDVFLFPSLHEGLPVTLVEAQANGLKIFASDTITKEVSLTDNIEYLSLEETPDYWAEKIISAMPYERKNNYEIIKKKGYDIKENTLKLQEFYLDQINFYNNERKNIFTRA